MSNIFIVVEQSYTGKGEYVPSCVLRDDNAIRVHFEEWFEDIPHFCIRSDGTFYRLRYDSVQKSIQLCKSEDLKPNVDLFINLLDRYFQSLGRSRDAKVRSAARYANNILTDKKIGSFEEIHSMADILDFY
jgi:hypothetical protein